MRLNRPTVFCSCCVAAVLAIGCGGKTQYQKVNSPRSMYVPTMPPDHKREITPAQPSRTHVWIDGSWHWNPTDETWTWQKGEWREPPKKGYEWRGPTYDKRDEQVIVYTPGYWTAKKAKARATKE